ncbi:MAG: TIGR01212 family radical SAM protein [Anaerovoracaceae bacterium]
MKNIFGSVHYNSIGSWLRKEFNCQISKLAFDGGFTCPNRDGTKGIGGCIFCGGDGAGHFSSTIDESQSQVQLLSRKWPNGKYIAYFQSFTSTYDHPDNLRKKYEEALQVPDVMGLAIATRPDCLSPKVLEVIKEFSERTFLWIELGLQSIHNKTAMLTNRCYSTDTYDRAVESLDKLDIRIVTHLIFGLPGETRKDMMESAIHIAKQTPFGIKLHQLYLMEGTPLFENNYLKDMLSFGSEESYIDLVVDVLEILPQSVTIHRLTGDAPTDRLLAPLWAKDKRSILNGIQQEFKKRGTFQGIHSPSLPSL